MLQLTNGPLKAAKMSEFYLAHLDEEFGAKVRREDDLAQARKNRQNRHLRRSQSTNVIGRAAYAVFDLFHQDKAAS